MNTYKVFVTTGTQIAFPRLIECVNEAATKFPNISIVAQTCNDEKEYSNILETFSHAHPSKYSEIIAQSDLIIGHAGIGTILTASEHNKKLAVMARDHRLNEHRNSHQFDTVAKFKDNSNVIILEGVEDIENVFGNIDNILPFSFNSGKNNTLTEFVSKFIENL